MARARDEKKRDIIIKVSKKLFAKNGFFNSSIADIVKETGLPVGTIYTYFASKDEIVRAIVDEGWADLQGRLLSSLEASPTVREKLKILLEKFLPELFNDIELIHILLAEAIDFTRIEEKVENLSDLIFSIIKEHMEHAIMDSVLTRQGLRTALVIYFLGILNAVKISRSASIGITAEDILDFIKQTIESSLKISL